MVIHLAPGPDPERIELSQALFEYLCNRYVQSQDTRQKLMGLQYTTAETHDLAQSVTMFVTNKLGVSHRVNVEADSGPTPDPRP